MKCLTAKRTLPNAHYSAQIMNDKNLTAITPSSFRMEHFSSPLNCELTFQLRPSLHGISIHWQSPRIRAICHLSISLRIRRVSAKSFRNPNHIEWLSLWALLKTQPNKEVHLGQTDPVRRFP